MKMVREKPKRVQIHGITNDLHMFSLVTIK